MRLLKKRPVFLALFLCLSFGAQAEDECRAQGPLESAKIKRVVDGDTIHFADGRKVRLVGINTPELDHKMGQHEPYAEAARDYLIRLLDGEVYFQAAQDSEDRYGRKLYYLFDKDRISLTSQLLSAGLGYRIAVPPNLSYQTCFEQAETLARSAHKRLWQNTLQWQPKAGFAITRVNISSVTRNRGGWWLESQYDLVINLPPYVADYWPAQKVFALQGKVLEVRGWQHYRKNRNAAFKSWVLSVRHPKDLREVKDSIAN